MRIVSILVLTTLFYLNTPAYATPPQCPQTLSMYAENKLTLKARHIFEEMYAKLGCKLSVRLLPPKRSVIYFNSSLIDGELYRLEDIEKSYTQTFVRSQFPLLSIPASLWASADPEIYKTRPLGYIKGYAWQERFIRQKPLLTPVAYKNEDDLYIAFNKGIIGSFLSNDPYVDFLQKEGLLSASLKKIMTLETRHFYHYLHAKYAPFMERFSELLAKEDNFAALYKE
ncbi:hypothetical protein GCM10011332_14870 [Terasakiella brassicae]|uniref:Solute-binding protein family 3/N-terminal domain-containing protein n=1 Tax=Terasakiella brassicae TaxID=1634917 RepID=A0A917BYR8_9PROT|nr:hypothetical protein [Terasakiella brassicae]GGF62051.1 hypothetical protein GCM10011332_14870 [Terasakiella brassicae]